METRANYVLIGAFTIAGFAGMLLFFLWFARVELDRQFAYFDVQFTSVSGLSRASEVRFGGLLVGQVVDLALTDEGRVRVRLEVGADTPVRADSQATVESFGVTGVSFVAISAGTPAAERLRYSAGEPPPEIPAGRSVIQSLSEDAPELIAEVLAIVRQVGDLFGDTNQERISSILDNVDRSSASFSGALDDFAEITQTVAAAAAEIGVFTERLEGIAEAATTTLQAAEVTLGNIDELSGTAIETLDAGTGALSAAEATLLSANRFLEDDLPVLVAGISDTADLVRLQADSIGEEARETLARFGEAGAAATARLEEAGATLAAADEMIAALTRTVQTVERAAEGFDDLIASDGAALVRDARTALGAAEDAIDALAVLARSDVPEVLEMVRSDGGAALAAARGTLAEAERFLAEDLRSAVTDLRQTGEALLAEVEAVGAEARGMIAGFGETGRVATARLTEAEATLAAADTMIAALTDTLGTVDRAADRFDRLLAGDGAALLAEARQAIGSADAAIAAVGRLAEDDLPAIIADVRAAAATASEVVSAVGADLSAATGRLDGLADGAAEAIGAATQTFAGANETLAAINSALEIGERTLEAAERAFDGADRVLGEDVAALTADLRATLGRLDGALAQVSADLPAVTADLRAASDAAAATFAEVQRAVRTATGPVEEFARQGLPQYTRLAQELRGLTRNFDRLIAQIERDPARFFFSRQAPEFRR